MAKLLLQNGALECFTVGKQGLSWHHKDRTQEESVQFNQLGLPNLTVARKFSISIDYWSKWEMEDIGHVAYANRIVMYQKYIPGVFGLSTYEKEHPGRGPVLRPCINECVVLGVLLSNNMGVEYTYEPCQAFSEVRFTKHRG